MSNVIGPDVSFYQDDNETPRGINFAQMASKSPYVIIRAGQNLWPDPDFKNNWAASKAAFLARGSYWFYDSRAKPIDQAIKWVGLFMYGEGGSDFGELPLFADFEESYGGAYTGWKYWIDFLEELRVLVGTKKEICIYTAYYYWKKNAPAPFVPLPPKYQDKYPGMDALTYFKQFRLWIANYDAPTPMIPPPWTDWLFWQYTEKGPGATYGAESNTIDLNYFHGDETALRAEFSLSGPPVVEIPDEEHFEAHYGMMIHRVFRSQSWCHVAVMEPSAFTFTPTIPGLKTCTQVALETGAQLVINGSDYYPSGHPNGLYYREGKYYAAQVDYQPYWHGAMNGFQSIRAYNAPGPKYNAMAGKRFLVEAGKAAVHTSAAWYETHPRTLIGVTLSGQVVVAVVDGRQPGYSVGMTLFQAANLMVDFGCVWATDLDGGGSSTFVLDGKLYNRPIDLGIPYQQRRVGNHFTATEKNAPPPPPTPLRNTNRAVVEYQYEGSVALEVMMK